MKSILSDIEEKWLAGDFTAAKTLSDLHIVHAVESLTNTEKDYIFPILKHIYAHCSDYETAAHFLVLYYPFLETEVLNGTKVSSLLDKALRNLLTYVDHIRGPQKARYESFLELKYRELAHYAYDGAGLEDCVADALFALRFGDARRALHIADIGRQNSVSDKGKQLFLRLQRRIIEGIED